MAKGRARAEAQQGIRIVRDPGIRGGAPIIEGSGVRVVDVAVRYELLGMSPEEIASALPHLTLAQIHAGLSYYYQNKAALDRDWRTAVRQVSRQRRRSSSVLEGKLGRLADLSG